jgi:hypothetical protein
MTSVFRSRRFVALAVFAALAAALAFLAPRAAAAPSWAPERAATVHPGIQLYTSGAQCTANFVFTDGSGTTYLGQAAHCSSKGGESQTNGCHTPSYPLGTPIKNAAGKKIGTLAYNSWLAMQKVGETNPNACAANDLALIKLNKAARQHTNPTIPHLGGPTGLDTNGAHFLNRVYAVGNSSLLGGLGSLVAQIGIIETNAYGGWSHYLLFVRPSIPGDSGSAVVNAQGQALGQLSTISIGTQGIGNTIGDMAKEISYAQHHGVSGLHVDKGTRSFNPLGLVGHPLLPRSVGLPL